MERCVEGRGRAAPVTAQDDRSAVGLRPLRGLIWGAAPAPMETYWTRSATAGLHRWLRRWLRRERITFDEFPEPVLRACPPYRHRR